MRRIGVVLSLFAVLLMAALFASWRVGGSRHMQRLVLTGSSTIAPVAGEIAKRFENVHPGVRVDVHSGGSSRGIADLRHGLADIGMISRALKKGETDLRFVQIAHDGVGMIVHRANSVRSLTNQEVIAIYRGEVRNWKQVGGADSPISVINKAEGRATLEVFKTFFGLRSQEIKPDAVIGHNEQGIKTVEGNPYAIAYVSIGAAEYGIRLGAAIRLLSLEGVEASSANVQGTYPLSRPLHLITVQQPSGVAKAFIEFARSDSVEDIIREQGFVPISR